MARARLLLPLDLKTSEHLEYTSRPTSPNRIFQYNTAKMAEGMFYNVTGGYVEGIVRGYRNTLLTGQNYGNLTQVGAEAL